MRFLPSLEQAILLRRYKRFLADVSLVSTGETLTVHCPNSGSMLGVQTPGTPIWIRKSSNSQRKYPYTWELSHENTTLVGINTQIPNILAAEAFASKILDPFKSYTTILREVSCSPKSRLDFLLKAKDIPSCYVEVKNVHLNLEGDAAFPDSVTTRGEKHLQELMALKSQGHRAAMLFVVQRSDLKSFRVAETIDPVYAVTLKKALDLGVEVFCYGCNVSSEEISFGSPLPLNL